MTNSLNYSVPLILPIGSANVNGFPGCIVPAASTPRLWLGFSLVSSATYPTDFIDLAGDEYNLVQLNIRGYIQETNLVNQIFSDEHLPKHPAFTRWWLTPIPIPLNTRLIIRFENMRATANTKQLVDFYVARRG